MNKKKTNHILRFILWSIPVIFLEALIYGYVRSNFESNYYLEGLVFGSIGVSLMIIYYLTGLDKKRDL